MRYNVFLFSSNDNELFSEHEKSVGSIKKAKETYNLFIVEAFNGEKVLAYKQGGEYDNVLPLLRLSKKTDWRIGEDKSSATKDRNKFLKFTYLGKTHESKLYA
jgi:hypothetical protein